MIEVMKAYSTDRRERVNESIERDEWNILEAARRYKVSEPPIERGLAPKRSTGTNATTPHAGNH